MSRGRLLLLAAAAAAAVIVVIVVVSRSDGDWPPDVHEPNDDAAAATDIGLGHRIASRMYRPDDVDWFALRLEVPGRIEIEGATKWIEVTLHDDGGERLPGPDVPAGTYKLRVEALVQFTQYPMLYEVRLSLTPTGAHALLGCATTAEELRRLIPSIRAVPKEKPSSGALRPVKPGFRLLERINDLELETPLPLHPTPGRLAVVADDGVGVHEAIELADGGPVPSRTAGAAVHFRYQDALGAGILDIEGRYYRWLSSNWQLPLARACYARVAAPADLRTMLRAWTAKPHGAFWSTWAVAWSWHRLGDDAKARAQLPAVRKAARGSERAWSAWLEATLLDERSDAVEIARLLKRAEEFAAPRDAVLFRELGRRWIEIGRGATGERLLLAALAVHPTDQRAHQALRDFYVAEDRFGAAASHQEIIVSLAGGSGDSLLDLCRCYMRLGLDKTCRRILRRLATESPHLKGRCDTLLNSIGR